MTTHSRTTELRPIGRGTLHTQPTDLEARREALREWAREGRKNKQQPTPADADAALAKRATAPVR
jgi:hypothetical protein